MQQRRRVVVLVLALSLVLTTGCWDRTELNELAIVLASGSDWSEDGQYELSDQIAIPAQLSSGQSSSGGQGKGYFVVWGQGHDLLEAAQELQTRLSRKIFLGHRRAIFIGERLAQHGLTHILDEYTRNPDLRLRGDIFMVRGGTARAALLAPHSFERLPALADVKALKTTGGPSDVTLRDFLIAASSETSIPTMQVIELGGSESESGNDDGGSENENSAQKGDRKIVGTAFFDKHLRLMGFLPLKEAILRQWMIGGLSHQFVTSFIPQGGGYVTLDAIHLHSSIEPVLQGTQLTFFVTLKGRGTVRENETNLDLTQSKSLRIIETYLNQDTAQSAQRMIEKMQSRYQADIFGFDQSVHRKYPQAWKSMRRNWPSHFASARVVVNVKLVIRRSGLTGPSLELQPDDIKG